MAAINSLLQFWHGGMDLDDAPIRVEKGDFLLGFNLRASGTTSGEDGYITNIESNILIQGNLHDGINKIVGAQGFEQIRKAVWFIFNSEGYHQIAVLDYDTNILTIAFENLTDSADVDILPLTAQNYVLDIKLVNNDFLIWNDGNAYPGYTDLTKLLAGGYGTLIAEDLALLKPQILPPPTGTYGSDNGQPANDLFALLPQFTVQYVNAEFNYSAWGTWSKRIVPYQQDTPTLGTDVTQNNYIVVSVNIGSERANTINIGCRFGTDIFEIVKSVDRTYILALPHSAVDVDNEIYEAYNSGTNTYSFAFYNNDIAIPVNPLETDLFYDYIWPCGATEVVNGNIIANADIKAGYERPTTSVTVAGIGYDPNIDIPAGTYPDPLKIVGYFPGASGSGAGGHKRIMSISLGGTPHTGDKIIVIVYDIRNSSTVKNYTFQVPSGLDGNLAGVIAAFTPIFPRSSYSGDTITWTDDPYFTMQNFAIQLFFAGATVANSIESVLDNWPYQAALSYRDSNGTPFPLRTDSSFQFTTPSKAQVNGQAIEISWTINDAAAPEGAVDYQWLLTKPDPPQLVETIATILNYKGTWDAVNNTPTLVVNDGSALVGDTYQITSPSSPAYPLTYHDLGDGASYNTGDYVVYNGQSWNVLDKTFGDLTSTGNILAFSLNPLQMFNAQYATQGVSTILGYEYAVNDRCTLHYWLGNAEGVDTFTITAGTGYTDGNYTDVALTGGSGADALANVTVAGGVVTAVTITYPGTGYTVGDSLTGTLPVGTGWSISVDSLTTFGANYFNQPCVNLSVFGFDAASYIVKMERSAAFVVSGGNTTYNGSKINGTNIFLRLYSPAPLEQTTSSVVNGTVYYEVGERFTITNGVHDTLSGTITTAGVFYKTRQMPDGLLPYTNPPIDVLATDFNYSDFYPSAFGSFGRPRYYNDELEKTERKAVITWSDTYVLGSKRNGLNRFYPANVYGTQGGETSDNFGAIQKMLNVNNELVVIQQLNHGSVPVYQVVYTDALQRTTVAVSEKLFAPIRYTTSKHIGVGEAKESIAIYNNIIYWIDPNRSQPVRWEGDGCFPISLKMSKYFKSTLQAAFAQGYKIIGWYDIFNDEYVISIQQPGAIISQFAFNGANWRYLEDYIIAPGDITITGAPSHSTPSYNSTTGILTLTPDANYVGSDSAIISFPAPGLGTVTKNVCFNWTAGSGSVSPFVFTPLMGVPLSEVEVSNVIGVSGNDYPVAISITGDTGLGYSINGGAFTSSPGTVSAGDNVQVRVTSSGSLNTLTSCTLTIDSQSATFDVTTRVAGNFTAYAQYGGIIDKVLDGTGSGVPAGYNPCNLTPGMALSAAYATLTAGTYQMVMDGAPSAPGHTYVTMIVNGVNVGTPQLFTGPRAYTFNLVTPANDPDTVEFTLILM